MVAQVSYDPAWRAYSGDTALAVQKDAMGFLRIDAPPGDLDIHLAFRLPLENIAGWIVSGWAVLASAALVVRGWRRRPRVTLGN